MHVAYALAYHSASCQKQGIFFRRKLFTSGGESRLQRLRHAAWPSRLRHVCCWNCPFPVRVECLDRISSMCGGVSLRASGFEGTRSRPEKWPKGEAAGKRRKGKRIWGWADWKSLHLLCTGARRLTTEASMARGERWGDG